ncbi:MAG: hypothetical protein Q8L48_37340 [Archangium sp.]|nr:hypothetical protein [Archangium sp.]
MGSVVLVVVLVVIGVAGLFALVRRLSRALLDRKEEVLVASLTAAGAARKGTKLGGLYEGNDVAFELDGCDVLVNARYDSRNLVRVGLLVKTGFLPWAVFSAERGLHHFGKKLGISRELQTGDAAFDQHCYVDSAEQDAVLKQLLASDSTREAIAGLIALGFHVQTSTRGVEAFQLAPLHEGRRESKAAEATALLARLAKAVPQFDGLEFKTPGDVRNLPLAALVVLFTAGGLFGALALAPTLGVTVNRAAAVAVLIGGGFALWATGVALLSVVARGSSDGIRALAISAGVTLLGLPALGGTLVLVANQRLDGAPPTVHQVTVRSTDSKALQVDSWEPGAPAVRVGASYGALQKFAVGDVVPVKVHPGALGLTWVEQLDAAYRWGL